MSSRTKLFWESPDGSRTEILDQEGTIQNVAVSRDGRHLAMEIDAANSNVWTFDIARKSLSRLTFKGSVGYPAWDAKGEMVYFSSTRRGIRSIYRRRADGGGEAELAFKGSDERSPRDCDVSPVGNQLCAVVVLRNGSSDLYRIDPEHPEEGVPFLDSRFLEFAPSFSPDGHWLAYASDETGTPEIYVRRFPQGDKKQKVSSHGGRDPQWSRNGSTLYYMGLRKIMKASIVQDENLLIGVPTVALSLPNARVDTDLGDIYSKKNFEVGPLKDRFLLTEVQSVGELPERLEIVLNWFDELKQKLGN
jgi:Tol biopolymer transport system component